MNIDWYFVDTFLLPFTVSIYIKGPKSHVHSVGSSSLNISSVKALSLITNNFYLNLSIHICLRRIFSVLNSNDSTWVRHRRRETIHWNHDESLYINVSYSDCLIINLEAHIRLKDYIISDNDYNSFWNYDNLICRNNVNTYVHSGDTYTFWNHLKNYWSNFYVYGSKIRHVLSVDFHSNFSDTAVISSYYYSVISSDD